MNRPKHEPTPEEFEAMKAQVRAEREAESKDQREIDYKRTYRHPKVYRDPQMNNRNRRRR